MNRVFVRRQVELGSAQWGIYVGSVLVEGGFFSREAAVEASAYWRHYA